jgi:hypothetical protein
LQLIHDHVFITKKEPVQDSQGNLQISHFEYVTPSK